MWCTNCWVSTRLADSLDYSIQPGSAMQYTRDHGLHPLITCIQSSPLKPSSCPGQPAPCACCRKQHAPPSRFLQQATPTDNNNRQCCCTVLKQHNLTLCTAVVSSGHVGMLADPTFAEIVHSIGLASLGADDKTIKHLTKVINTDKRLQYTVMEYKTAVTVLPEHHMICLNAN